MMQITPRWPDRIHESWFQPVLTPANRRAVGGAGRPFPGLARPLVEFPCTAMGDEQTTTSTPSSCRRRAVSPRTGSRSHGSWRGSPGEIADTWNTGTAAQLPSGRPVKWCTPTPSPPRHTPAPAPLQWKAVIDSSLPEHWKVEERAQAAEAALQPKTTGATGVEVITRRATVLASEQRAIFPVRAGCREGCTGTPAARCRRWRLDRRVRKVTSAVEIDVDRMAALLTRTCSGSSSAGQGRLSAGDVVVVRPAPRRACSRRRSLPSAVAVGSSIGYGVEAGAAQPAHWAARWRRSCPAARCSRGCPRRSPAAPTRASAVVGLGSRALEINSAGVAKSMP